MGPVNQVLVVGSPHLAQMGDAVKAEMLTPLLDRLAAWAPEVIAIENVSGLQCDAMRRYPQRYRVSISDYCPDVSHAGQQAGLDVPAANAEAERLLAEWPAAPSPEQRRRLAAVFLAAGEPTSALVQWLRLAPAERREGEGLDATLVAQLNTLTDSINESDAVAAASTARTESIRYQSAAEQTEQIDTAVSQGATLLTGGTRDGAFFAPTVLADVTPEMDVYREELFGPAAVVYRVADEDAAVDLANDTTFGLGSYVFTTDEEQAARVADRIDAGLSAAVRRTEILGIH